MAKRKTFSFHEFFVNKEYEYDNPLGRIEMLWDIWWLWASDNEKDLSEERGYSDTIGGIKISRTTKEVQESYINLMVSGTDGTVMTMLPYMLLDWEEAIMKADT